MAKQQTWTFSAEQPEEELWFLNFSGQWQKDGLPPDHQVLLNSIPETAQTVVFNTQELTEYDSSFIALLYKLCRHFEKENIRVQRDQLPETINRLLSLSLSGAIRGKMEHVKPDNSVAYQVGIATLDIANGFGELLGIIGASIRSVYEYIINRSRAPFKFVLNAMQTDGPNALGIVSLIGFLIGVTLAFIGAVELQKFGATIFVADLVMVGMARELAPLMTGVVMAGRSGASIAASIGAMLANEEIDALKTMGISPVNYLVSPRTVGLITMMPLLVAYAYVLGNLGGALVATTLLKLSLLEYLTQARSSVDLGNFFIGLGKGVVFGFLISISGSLRGLNATRSAQGVGYATTSAVVTAIVLIIISNVIIDIVLHALGI